MSGQQLTHVDDRHAILSIAIKPRDTFQYVLKEKKLSYFMIIGIIGMFGSNLVTLIGTDIYGQSSLGDIVFSAFMSGILFYFLSTALVAGVLLLSAKVLGGKGTFKEMFRMISMTMVPYIWLLPVILFWMQFAPQSFFEIPYIESTLADYIIQFICGTFVMVASIWTFILTVVGISEVHKLSKWRAFFASILVVIVLGIVVAFALLNGIAF